MRKTKAQIAHSEAVKAGMQRAAANGAQIGRPAALTPKQDKQVARLWFKLTLRELCEQFGVSKTAIRNAARRAA